MSQPVLWQIHHLPRSTAPVWFLSSQTHAQSYLLYSLFTRISITHQWRWCPKGQRVSVNSTVPHWKVKLTYLGRGELRTESTAAQHRHPLNEFRSNQRRTKIRGVRALRALTDAGYRTGRVNAPLCSFITTARDPECDGAQWVGVAAWLGE